MIELNPVPGRRPKPSRVRMRDKYRASRAKALERGVRLPGYLGRVFWADGTRRLVSPRNSRPAPEHVAPQAVSSKAKNQAKRARRAAQARVNKLVTARQPRKRRSRWHRRLVAKLDKKLNERLGAS